MGRLPRLEDTFWRLWARALRIAGLPPGNGFDDEGGRIDDIIEHDGNRLGGILGGHVSPGFGALLVHAHFYDNLAGIGIEILAGVFDGFPFDSRLIAAGYGSDSIEIEDRNRFAVVVGILFAPAEFKILGEVVADAGIAQISVDRP